jgi:DNA-binding transcriptional regulator YiaG
MRHGIEDVAENEEVPGHQLGPTLESLLGQAQTLAELCASPMDVHALRRKLHLSQRDFAGRFGFPLATLRHWERGDRKPTGTALVLLHVIRDNPRAVLLAVRKARRSEPGRLARVKPYKSMRAPPGFGERGPPLRPRGPRRR